jgi:hypothetical protein
VPAIAFGISGGGADAESQFLLLTGATPALRAADGDAVLDGHLVEVKRASSVTLNQVRATKYITLVAYEVGADAWYVVPAHEVVRHVSRKRRGQHTENPFESATLSLRNLSEFRVAEVSKLKGAVLQAVADSAEYPAVQDEMKRVLSESRRLADDSIARVRAALGEI